jgi:spermidine synthase
MLTQRNRLVLFLAVCALGISAFVTQLVLMRELLGVFSGNELIFGIVLGNWLLLTGAGSYLGRIAPRLRDPVAVLIVAEILVAVVPVADVFVLRTVRDRIFIRGAEVGVTETVLSCFVLLAPYCLVAGFLLTLSSLILASRKDSSSIGQVYFLDNVGDIVGGVLFSFVLVYWFDHFRILYFPAALNLLFAILVALLFARRVLLGLAATVAVALVALVATHDLDDLSVRLQYAGQEILHQGHSPYGRLIVTESSGQVNFIHNGVVLFAAQAARSKEAARYADKDVEETVHYAMSQRPDAERVLLISGGVSGTAQEILKYWEDRPQAPARDRGSPTRPFGGAAACPPDGTAGRVGVDYVELDPEIIRVAREYLPESLADPHGRIRVFTTDGRRFVRQAAEPYRYDVVIVDVPDPSTSQINRFYTREFFEEVSRRLASDGVVSISLAAYENYLSDELANLIAVAHRTLRQVFRHVLIVPGGRIYFLASDGPLSTEIATRLEEEGIETAWVKRPYLEQDVLRPLRREGVRRAISEDAPVNEDFNPILYYYHLRYWISQFRTSFGFLEGGLLLVFLIALLRARPVSFAIFTTGLAASALEVVLLVGFQILYGCVYHRVGLIITMFMLGLGIGSATMNRILPRRTRRDLAALELGVAVYAASLPWVLILLGRIDNPAAAAVASQAAVPLLALVLAVLVGLEFPLAGKADFHTVSSTAARLYTADYLGAALGALLVSTLLIPVMGVVAVCLLAAGLNVLSGAVVMGTSRG